MPANPNDQRVINRLRAMSGAERVRLGDGLRIMADHIAAAGVRHAHPDWSEDQVQHEVRRRIEQSKRIYNGNGSPT